MVLKAGIKNASMLIFTDFKVNLLKPVHWTRVQKMHIAMWMHCVYIYI